MQRMGGHKFLPPAYVVRRDVMFSPVSVNTGGVPKSQVPSQVLSRGTPVLTRGGYPSTLFPPPRPGQDGVPPPPPAMSGWSTPRDNSGVSTCYAAGASCVHAGGLSCWRLCLRAVLNLNVDGNAKITCERTLMINITKHPLRCYLC